MIEAGPAGTPGPTGGRAATLVLRHPNTNTKLER